MAFSSHREELHVVLVAFWQLCLIHIMFGSYQTGGVVEWRRDVSAQGPCLHTLQHSVLSTEAHLSANKQTPPRLSVSTIKRFVVLGRDLPPAPAWAPTRAAHLHTGSLVFLGPCDVQYFRRCDGEIGLITAEQSLRRPDLRL